MRRAVTGVLVVGAVAGTAIVMLWAAQRKLIYFPTRSVPPAALVSEHIEEVSFPTRDGLTLAAWMVPAARGTGGATVVLFHGNGGNRADRFPIAERIAAAGHNVLLVDYRGYGGNPGSPSQEGLLEDGRAAIEYVTSRPDVDPDRIVYFGESLGAAVATGVSSTTPPAGLILRSPFTSLSDVAAVHYPFLPTGLLRDRYPSIEWILGVDVPVLVIAGTRDTIVPISQSRDIHDVAPGPKRFVAVEGADHNDAALMIGAAVIDEVVAFLADLP